MQRKWRLAAAAAALLALLGTAVIAGLAAALPDTLYTDEPAAELRIASLPYLSACKKQALCLRTAPRPTQAAMLRWHCSVCFLSRRCVQSPRRGARCSCAVPPSGSSCFPMARWSWHSLTGTRRWAARIPPRRRGCGWGISSSRQMGSRCAAMRI